jgi:large subunit ribosomal protein L9
VKVILIQDVKALGKRGEVVNVSDGYARNFLFPKALAKEASDVAMRELEHSNKVADDKKARELAAARALADRMQEKAIAVPVKTGENGKLYGAVTNQDVAAVLGKVIGEKLDKRKVELKEPIKKIGQFKVGVKLHPQVTAEVTVDIVAAVGVS